MSFTAKDVMALRQATGMGMMECKKALTENNGDAGAAKEWLRERAKGKMDERTERVTAEGRIGIAINGGGAAIIEVQTETDFTAKNEAFAGMVQDVCKSALNQPAGAVTADDEITKRIDDVRVTTRENVNLARGEKLEGGSFGSYIHFDNKRGALLQLEGDVDSDTLTGICMHIVAHVPPPIGVDESDVPADEIEKIRAEAIANAKEAGKNDEITQKIADGKVRKHLQEVTLLNQKFVKDPDGKQMVKDVLPAGATIKRFVRYIVGGS